VKNVFLLAGALLVAAPQAGAQVTSDEAEIRRTRTESNQAIARHDVPAVLATMVEDFHVSISTGAFRSSRAEMGEAFAMRFEEFEDALYVRTPTTVEISGPGGLRNR
jgi:ketosteroid isomerase-like protein